MSDSHNLRVMSQAYIERMLALFGETRTPNKAFWKNCTVKALEKLKKQRRKRITEAQNTVLMVALALDNDTKGDHHALEKERLALEEKIGPQLDYLSALTIYLLFVREKKRRMAEGQWIEKE